MEELRLDRDTVLLMIMQYLKSNSLLESFKTLQQESKIAFRIVQSQGEICKAVMEGAWTKVLALLKNVALPDKLIGMLYSQFIEELCSKKEFDLATFLLQKHGQKLMICDKARYTQLVGMLKSKKAEIGDILNQRKKLVDAICSWTTELNSNTRLIDLIKAGILAEGESTICHTQARQSEPIVEELKSQDKPKDIATETPVLRVPQVIENEEIKESQNDVESKAPNETTSYIRIPTKKKFSDMKYHVKIAKYTLDGNTLITGSMDGFVELLNASTLELRKDIKYQEQKKFMLHEEGVLALDITSDSTMICAGDEIGTLKVWRISDGKCLRKLAYAHTHPITCCKFMAKNSQVVSGCQGGRIRIHGLKSAALLKEYRGHTAYIIDLVLLDSDNTLVTASADSTIRFWDLPSGVQRIKITPREGSSINSMSLHPNNPERLLICNNCTELIVINRKGEVQQRIETEEKMKSDFTEAYYTPDGKWIYAAAQNLRLYVFDANDGKLIRVLERVHRSTIFGIAIHPKEAKAVTYGNDGYLLLWEG